LPVLPGDVVNTYAHVTAHINQRYVIAQGKIWSYVIAQFYVKVNPAVLYIIRICRFLPELKRDESTEWGGGQGCWQPPPLTTQFKMASVYRDNVNKKIKRKSSEVIFITSPTHS